MTGRMPRRAMMTIALSFVVMLTMSTQSYAAAALIYNPLEMYDSTVETYENHPVRYFAGWTHRFAMDLNSIHEYANAPVSLEGSGWTQAIVKSAPDGPITWQVFRWVGGVCEPVGYEKALPFTLRLPNGDYTTGFSISHLSESYYLGGQLAPNGGQVGKLSYLSDPGNTYHYSNCTSLNGTNPHLHIESARTGTTTSNEVDPINDAWWQPYWYYTYP